VSRRGWVLFALMSVIWGMPYLFIKVADGGVAVPVLVFSRVTIAAALLLPLALRGRQFGGLWRHWRWLILFACVEMIVPWALLSNAERQLSSSMTGLLIASVPIITVAVLAGRGALGGDLWSVAQVLLVAVCYSTGPLIANRKLSELPVLAVNAFCLSFAAIVYSPAAALTWPSSVPSVQVLASLAALAVICTALAFVLFFKLIAEVGPARAMVFTYVNPAVAVALGVAVLGEPLSPEIVAAFGLILAGSVLATRPGRPGMASGPRPGRPAGAEPASRERASGEPAGGEPAGRPAGEAAPR
jgi:drug/metabolite transporter (DMT)-like permease